jgi:hypothetical protein
LYNNNLIHVCFLIQTLENVQEEEEEDDDDNSFDHRDDMSESLPTGDGGSGRKTGDEVDDGTSKAKKARKGGKKLVLHCLPSARQEEKEQHVGNILLLLKCSPRRREVSWRPRQSASSAIGVICTTQVVPLLL